MNPQLDARRSDVSVSIFAATTPVKRQVKAGVAYDDSPVSQTSASRPAVSLHFLDRSNGAGSQHGLRFFRSDWIAAVST